MICPMQMRPFVRETALKKGKKEVRGVVRILSPW